MGCGPSRPPRRKSIATPLRPLNISLPQGGPILIPEQRRDEHGRPIRPEQYELSRSNLQRALRYVATYLRDRNNDVVMIAVGGAVNTILLQSRETTHDVDFINPSATPQQMRLLQRAASAAIAQISIRLGDNWLNNTTTLYLSSQLQDELGREAIAQNDIVFQEPGLTVLAAPWRYALCAKIDRMGSPNRRPYDSGDAATYLRRHIASNKGRPALFKDLRDWARHYRTEVLEHIVQEINAEYLQRYGADGIVF